MARIDPLLVDDPRIIRDLRSPVPLTRDIDPLYGRAPGYNRPPQAGFRPADPIQLRRFVNEGKRMAGANTPEAEADRLRAVRYRRARRQAEQAARAEFDETHRRTQAQSKFETTYNEALRARPSASPPPDLDPGRPRGSVPPDWLRPPAYGSPDFVGAGPLPPSSTGFVGPHDPSPGYKYASSPLSPDREAAAINEAKHRRTPGPPVDAKSRHPTGRYVGAVAGATGRALRIPGVQYTGLGLLGLSGAAGAVSLGRELGLTPEEMATYGLGGAVAGGVVGGGIGAGYAAGRGEGLKAGYQNIGRELKTTGKEVGKMASTAFTKGPHSSEMDALREEIDLRRGEIGKPTAPDVELSWSKQQQQKLDGLNNNLRNSEARINSLSQQIESGFGPGGESLSRDQVDNLRNARIKAREHHAKIKDHIFTASNELPKGSKSTLGSRTREKVEEVFTEPGKTFEKSVDAGADAAQATKEEVKATGEKVKKKFGIIGKYMGNFYGRTKGALGLSKDVETGKRKRTPFQFKGGKLKRYGKVATVGEFLNISGQIHSRMRAGQDIGEATKAEFREMFEGAMQAMTEDLPDWMMSGKSGKQKAIDVAMFALSTVGDIIGLVPQAYKVAYNVGTAGAEALGDAGFEFFQGDREYYDLDKSPFDVFGGFETSVAQDMVDDFNRMPKKEQEKMLQEVGLEGRRELTEAMRIVQGFPEQMIEQPQGLASELEDFQRPANAALTPEEADAQEGIPPAPPAAQGLQLKPQVVDAPTMEANQDFTEFGVSTGDRGRGFVKTSELPGDAGRFPHPEFASNFEESVEAGAYNPLTPERYKEGLRSAQMVNRGLTAMQDLSGARMGGVPGQYVDAVRGGHLSPREAIGLGASTQGATGGLTQAQALAHQRGLRAQGVREQGQAATQGFKMIEGLTDENPEKVRLYENQILSMPITPENIPKQLQTVRNALLEVGDGDFPGIMLPMEWGGHAQGPGDPDLDELGLSLKHIGALRVDTRGTFGDHNVIMFGDDPIATVDSLRKTAPDVYNFLLLVNPNLRPKPE